MTLDSGVGAVDFDDAGVGPTVLFVPGSFSTPAAWHPIRKRLPSKYRFVATSLCGYGATTETRSIDDLDIVHEVRVVEAVARHVDTPVHLVGHSFGGTVSLAAALAGQIDVRSIAVFEANPLELMKAHGRNDLHDETFAMSQAFEAAQESGERDAAGRIIDFWGGEGSFAAMPDAVQE